MAILPRLDARRPVHHAVAMYALLACALLAAACARDMPLPGPSPPAPAPAAAAAERTRVDSGSRRVRRRSQAGGLPTAETLSTARRPSKSPGPDDTAADAGELDVTRDRQGQPFRTRLRQSSQRGCELRAPTRCGVACRLGHHYFIVDRSTGAGTPPYFDAALDFSSDAGAGDEHEGADRGLLHTDHGSRSPAAIREDEEHDLRQCTSSGRRPPDVARARALPARRTPSGTIPRRPTWAHPPVDRPGARSTREP